MTSSTVYGKSSITSLLAAEKKSNLESNNVLKLSLRKPKQCNWELTTSKSSPNIAFPKIQLYDNKGKLLATTNRSDRIFKGSDNSTNENFNIKTKSNPNIVSNNIFDKLDDHKKIKVEHSRSKSLQDNLSHETSIQRPSRRSLSSNLCANVDEANSIISHFITNLEKKGIDYKIRRHNSNEINNKLSKGGGAKYVVKNIDINGSDEMRRKILKEKIREDLETIYPKVELNRDKNKIENKQNFNSLPRRALTDNRLLDCVPDVGTNFSISKSKSVLEIPKHNSLSSLKEHGKKEYRRVHSSNSLKFSPSILERMSASKRRSSSSDSSDVLKSKTHCETEQDNNDKPKYTLRTSKAGTIIVCEESFRNRKVRRRQRSSSRSRNEIDDSGVVKCQEIIKTEYEYIGKTSRKTSPTTKKTINETELQVSKETRYDTAIAGIDKLISKLNSQEITDRRHSFNSAMYQNCKNVDESNKSFPGKEISSKKKVIKRRSVSAGSERHSSSPSADNEESSEKRKRRRGTSRKKNEFDKKSGDQIVAINNVLHSSLETSPLILSNKSDEVILRLVNRLASLRHHSNATNKNQYSTNVSQQSSASISPAALANHPKHNEPLENELVTNLEIESLTDEKPNKLKHSANNMGSNVSRHTEKGFSGRRTQSSGNLCSEKQQPPQSSTSNGKTVSKSKKVQRYDAENLNQKSCNQIGRGSTFNGRNEKDENLDESCSVIISPLCVGIKDRNKFCGSLPNHLDSDDVFDDDFVHNSNLYYHDNENTLERVEYVTVAPRKQQHPCQQQILIHQQHHYQHQQSNHHPSQSSPYNNSSSGKGSITSSTNLGSSAVKSNLGDNRAELQIKIPLHRINVDAGCDQGYGSERSPEDEMAPPLPIIMDGNYDDFLSSTGYNHSNWSVHGGEYNFITKDCTFLVDILKGPRGLGLSVSGGSDSNTAFPGLIRIKRLFPHQAAWSTGMLQPGDIILQVNGITLTGLTNYEALEVLRTTPNNVKLIVCRPRDERYRKLSPPTEPPKPPQRTSIHNQQKNIDTCSIPLESLMHIQTNFNGEFEIMMTKQQGSLGFTLRKEDESVLGHYVRALVREPALTDGRIQAGDKIVAVNDTLLSPMTHEEAVIFLRQAAENVKLRLFRDIAQTPTTALSPSNSENRTFSNTLKTRANLRPEAINLLSDLAYRKHTPEDSKQSSIRSTATMPRRLKRGTKSNSSGHSFQTTDAEGTDQKYTSYPKYMVSSQTSNSDSDTSSFSQCSYVVQPTSTVNIYKAPNENHSTQNFDNNLEYYEEDELFRIVDGNDDRPDRPNFLDLADQSGSTPVVPRKPFYQFTVPANAYELNNLDNEALDAPIYSGRLIESSDMENVDNFNSLPCETILVACRTESDLSNGDSFQHNSPMYSSAVFQCSTTAGDKLPSSNEKNITGGTKSLLKWKGVMFSPDEEKETTPGAESSYAAVTVATNPTPGTSRDLEFNRFNGNTEGHKVFVVELNRGWNSRLGFSLQEDLTTKGTVVSAIYSDSVAAKDKRLKVGDQIVMVNDEAVTTKSTSEIIELLRIIRGSICLTVLRKL